jgi:predicted O-methyltransferase YrrM
VHYYSPVPNIVELKRTKHIWAKKSELPGIEVNLDAQVSMLKRMCLPFRDEYLANKYYKHGTESGFGPGYGYIEAQALHAAVRYYKPTRIVEVGAGVSTYCMWNAARLNDAESGTQTRLTCIDPDPSPALRSLEGVSLIRNTVQAVPMDVFLHLEQRDLLFVDSSHTVKPGGDVNHIILELLPGLRDGVIVHFHDITLPYDYQRDVLETFLHWSETSILRAFFMFNSRARILVSLSMLHYERPESLLEVFPEYRRALDEDGLMVGPYKAFQSSADHFPSALYAEIC